MRQCKSTERYGNGGNDEDDDADVQGVVPMA